MIAAFVLVGFTTKAQELIKTYALEFGRWNVKTKDWDWEPRNFVKLDMLMYNDVIIIDDEARSVYIAKKLIHNTEEETRWSGFDNDKVDCYISMFTYDNENYLVIVYRNICYRYIY